jgi:UDP-N-acetylmuramoyl-tripeptide--D-alanyl-D-alanine ligase
MRWTVEQVAGAMGVAPPPGLDPVARLAGVAIDSRAIRRGELFVAIRGPHHDGHDFVAQSLAAEALAGLVLRSRWDHYPEETRARLFAVDDTLAAFQQLARTVARAWRETGADRRIAAVTGSAGKTTTKEILAALLGARLCVLKSEGNLNNEYGLPLTLLRLEEEHDAAVVELGMSRRGELARLAKIAEPEVGVVTNVGPVHLEFFSSEDEIALAKRELIEGLGGAAPVAVLNADDARVARFAEGFRGRVLTYGLSSPAQFRAEAIENRGVAGSAFDFVSPAGRARLSLGLIGRHNIANALGALAAASEWDIGAEEAAPVLAAMRPAAMRGEVLQFEAGFTVVNDCYNSNPPALVQLITQVAETPGYRRRIVAAGGMLELGAASRKLHRAAGRDAVLSAARANKIDWFFSVGGDGSDFVAGVCDAGHRTDRVKFFPAVEAAAEFLSKFIEPGDLLLVKGSRGIRMERIVDALRESFAERPDASDETVRTEHR